MRTASLALLEAIRTKGSVSGSIVKVDTFLNHQVDTRLVRLLAEDVVEAFRQTGVTKILTVETSGIILAQPVAMMLDVPYVYAKKKRPITMREAYSADSYSFTKQESTTLYVSKEVLGAGERILFVDDFFAYGATYDAACKIVAEAGSEMVGCAVIINKSDRTDVHSALTLKDIID